jgi:CRP-like cAMP-binding protein
MIGLDDLKRYSLFGGIMDDDLSLIRNLLKPVHYAVGEDLMREGDRGDRLFFLLDGEVEILVTDASDPAKAQQRVAILPAGETVGEMELIDIQPRMATVRALTDVSAVYLTNKDLFTIKNSHLETFTLIIMNLARDISRRLRHMDRQVVLERHQRTDAIHKVAP